ncbi:5'/3'-nucleotidase SurE [Geopsychrobacter electrodiphilus]|uniref:5'/3'-nucleotidase SurE n=1 Tax=Geopsychrobacter electrodiphilus TaxID=225196 RepID=UPI00037F0BA5|nr:5'/3'-nucleotidase SurE [Geopsychrobacter electrodiphilus]
MSFILVTNDDGVHSPGLACLADAVAEFHQIVIVAPDRNRSAIGHALTLDSPLRADEIRRGVFSIDGTPTDCVNLGVHGLVEGKPLLVVSGVNLGANMGDDITYSGTVCAALEAALMGIPAIAFSLDAREFTHADLIRVSTIARNLVRQVLIIGMAEGTFLNVNIPTGEINGICLTCQGKRHYGEGIIQKTDPRGRIYYWIGGGIAGFENIPGSDCNAVAAGQVSITPLRTGLTSEVALKEMADWDLSRTLD